MAALIRSVWRTPVAEIVTALFLVIGYEVPQVWFLAIFGIALFTSRVSHGIGNRQVFGRGWLIGTMFFALAIRWFFAVWPAEWLGLEKDPAVLPLIFVAWLVLASFTGLAAGALGIVLFGIRSIVAQPGLFVMVVPSLWVLYEYLRAWLFALISWGPNALLGPHWTFGHIGYVLAGWGFTRLPATAGLYGMSWVTAFFAALIFLFSHVGLRRTFSGRGRIVIFAVLAVLLFVRLIPIVGRSGTPPLSVIVFQSDTRAGQVLYREAIRNAIDEFLRENPVSRPDIIVLPEDAQLFSISEEEEKALLARFFPDTQKAGLVVTNATVVENGRRVKYTLYVDRGGEIIGRQPKTFLIPAGEIMPVALAGILRVIGRSDMLRIFDERRAMSRLPLEPKFVEFGNVKLSAAVCSGVLTPRIYRELARSGAQILLNQTSFSVFHGSPLLLKETERMARFQAAANARPLIQSANAGYSLVIDGRGKIVARPEKPGNYLIAAEVTPGRAKTPTQRFGDWPVGASAALALAALGFGKRSIRSE